MGNLPASSAGGRRPPVLRDEDRDPGWSELHDFLRGIPDVSRKRVEVIEGIVDICYNVVVARSLGAQQITLSDECQDTLGLLGPAAERLNGRPTIPAEGAMPHPNLQAVGMAELVKVLHKTTVEERR